MKIITNLKKKLWVVVKSKCLKLICCKDYANKLIKNYFSNIKLKFFVFQTRTNLYYSS